MERENKKMKPANVLIIQQDLGTQLLWEFSLNAVHPFVNIMTASRPEDASDLLELAIHNGFYYDLVIYDMRMNTDRDGHDLWESYTKSSECSVILTNGSEEEFEKKIGGLFLPVFAPQGLGVFGMTEIVRELMGRELSRSLPSSTG